MDSAKMNRRVLLSLAAILIISILILCSYIFVFHDSIFSSLVYQLTVSHGHKSYYVDRGISTKIDLWLNGYLGVFFRYKAFGFIPWLGIPLITYFFITLQKRKRWEVALALSLCFSILFICVQGYSNYRYQLTLFPLVLTLIMCFGWKIIYKKDLKLQKIAIGICFCLLVMNILYSFDTYATYWNVGIGKGKYVDHFPDRLVKFINNDITLDDDSVILECNIPFLYYYTDKKGLSYKIDIRRMINDKKINFEDSFYILREKLHVEYILLQRDVSGRLKQIIKDCCVLVCDDQGFRLYKVFDCSIKNSIQKRLDEIPVFETQFLSWEGNDNVSDSDMSNALYPLTIFGKDGEFNFQRLPSRNGNILRVMLKQSDFNKIPIIQFGYSLYPSELNIKVEVGDCVVIVAGVRSSSKNLERTEIFLQEKTDYWIRESEHVKQQSWHEVMQYIRVREDSNQLFLGICWRPETTHDWLDVKYIRIYIIKQNELSIE